MKILKKSHSSVEFDSEESQERRTSEYLPSDEKKGKKILINKKEQSSVNYDSEGSQ